MYSENDFVLGLKLVINNLKITIQKLIKSLHPQKNTSPTKLFLIFRFSVKLGEKFI